MKLLKRIALCFFSCCIAATCAGIPLRGQSGKSDSGGPVVVFAVWPAGAGPEKDADQPDVPLLDPIAVLKAGTFRGLPGFDSKDEKAHDAAYDRFEKRYFARGSRYPFLLRGAQRGNLTVEDPVGVSCISTTASAKLPRLLSDGEMGLALSSANARASHADLDATVTTAERAIFRDAASAYLVRKGVPKAATSGIQIADLHSLYLSAQWRRSLAGSIILRRKDALYTLFLVLTEKDGKLVPALASYHPAADVEDGTDSVDEILLSHFDFDNDGIDEIIATSYYYESWDYTIYRYRDGAWHSVYKGGGGGC